MVRSEHARQANLTCALFCGLVKVLNLIERVARARVQNHGRVLDQRVGAEAFKTPDSMPRVIDQSMRLVNLLLRIVTCF